MPEWSGVFPFVGAILIFLLLAPWRLRRRRNAAAAYVRATPESETIHALASYINALESRIERLEAAGSPGVDPRRNGDVDWALGRLGFERGADPDAREITAAFRRMAKHAHPDGGGTAAGFDALVYARDLLLKTASP